jgi:hypothetical protein
MATKPDTPKEPANYGAPTKDVGTPAIDAVSALRHAELKYAVAAQDALLSYNKRSATAYAEYQNALAELSRSSGGEELQAASDLSDALRVAGTRSEPTQTAFEKWRSRVGSSRVEARRKMDGAEHQYSAAIQQAWYDYLDRQREALSQYADAAQKVNIAGTAGLASYSVAGDEGLAGWPPSMTMQNPMDFRLAWRLW